MKRNNPNGCEEIRQHVFEYLDEQIGVVMRRAVEHHLKLCRSCFDRIEFERELQALLRTVSRKPVRASFKHRIQSLLRQSHNHE